jgi:integrase
MNRQRFWTGSSSGGRDGSRIRLRLLGTLSLSVVRQPGAVEQQDGVRAARDRAADLVGMGLHGVCVGERHGDPSPDAARRADRSEQVGALVALVGWLARPCPAPRPLPHDAVLLADAGLVPGSSPGQAPRRKDATDTFSIRAERFVSGPVKRVSNVEGGVRRRPAAVPIVWARIALSSESPVALAAIRFMLLTGFRRMEVLALEHTWIDAGSSCIRFPKTKGGAQIRAIGDAALALLQQQPVFPGSRYAFPSEVGDGHFVGVVRVLQRLCAAARLDDVTPHVLRHTFASVAGDLGFSELTIAGLLGHAGRGVTQRHVHLDRALVLAADKAAEEIQRALEAHPPAATG